MTRPATRGDRRAPPAPANAHVLSLAALSCLLGARTAGARGPLAVLAASLAADLAACAVLGVPAVWWFYALAVLPAALLLPWLTGRHWRGRRELVREGWRLAGSLEERQHLVAERVRLAERADIAADMHDSLGHVLSLVALRAGALELSPDLTDRDRADLAELRGTVADAVERLRETVAVLHEPHGGGPGTDTVEDLLARAVASGVPVRWERRGTFTGTLPPLVERGTYRVVQEALTNAVKHAPGAGVRVGIDHGPDRTRVSVVNTAARDGEPAATGVAAGSGRGLTGLRERVAVLGGTLRTGPYQDGFRVTADLPHRAPARRTDPGPRRQRPGVHRTARRGTPHRPPPSRGRLRGTGRRGGLLPPGRRRPRLAADDGRAAALPLRRTGAGSAPHRARPPAPGPGLPVPARPPPLRPRPAGADCEFYRSGRDLLDQVDLYRLCWPDGHLVSKDTLKAT